MVPHRRTRQSELVGETSRPGTTVAATKQQRHCLLSTQDVDKAGGEIVGKTVRSALLLGSKLQPHTDPMNGQGHELDSCCNSLAIGSYSTKKEKLAFPHGAPDALSCYRPLGFKQPNVPAVSAATYLGMSSRNFTRRPQIERNRKMMPCRNTNLIELRAGRPKIHDVQ
eukprot:617323-Pelagomonas_calceolata.AAC.5